MGTFERGGSWRKHIIGFPIFNFAEAGWTGSEMFLIFLYLGFNFFVGAYVGLPSFLSV